MASAWGSSWGVAWGDSWGSVGAVATQVFQGAGRGEEDDLWRGFTEYREALQALRREVDKPKPVTRQIKRAVQRLVEVVEVPPFVEPVRPIQALVQQPLTRESRGEIDDFLEKSERALRALRDEEDAIAILLLS